MIHPPPTHLPLGRVALWETRPASRHACRPSLTIILAHGAPTPSPLGPRPQRAPARAAVNLTRGQGRLPDLRGTRTLGQKLAAHERSSTPPVLPAMSQNGPRPKYVRRGSTWNGPSLYRYSSMLHHRWNPRRVPAGSSQLALLASYSSPPRSKPCTGVQCPSCP